LIYSTSLASHPNPVWSCADLIDQVWGYDNLSPNLLPFYRKFGLKTPPFRVTEGGLITLTFWLFVTLYAKSTDKMPRQHTSNPKIPKVSKAIASSFY